MLILRQVRFLEWFRGKGKTVRFVGMIASANFLGLVIGIAGSLIQAHFIPPEDLGFVRKYSVVANYAMFLSLGLYLILRREYPVLMGQGKKEQAYRVSALVQSWYLLISGIVCGVLCLVAIGEIISGHWREAAAWFIQIVAVWTIIYGSYQSSIFRSAEEFERLAKGQFWAAVTNAAVLPLFWIIPFGALVLRSVASSLVTSVYLHIVRPIKLGWYFSWREFAGLARRAIQLYVGDYLRYMFWPTVEIWLMLRLAGDVGVGLLVFSKMIAEAASQVLIAINQVYQPRVAQRFGETNSVRACLKLALKPSLFNLGVSVLVTLGVWLVVPPILEWIFPKYVQAIPLLRILVLQTLVVSVSLPLYMVVVLEGYLAQLTAAILGLLVFLGVAFFLHRSGLGMTAVAWGTLAGQMAFAAVSLGWIWVRARREAEQVKAVVA